MGTAFVNGLQGDDPHYLKIVSTPKHLPPTTKSIIALSAIHRYRRNNCVNITFLLYEMCVKEGKAASIMSAYNALNDVPAR